MIIRAPFSSSLAIAHGQLQLNPPHRNTIAYAQAPAIQSSLHQDLFQKQVRFKGGPETFSPSVKEAFEDYFLERKQQEDDKPPETMADIKQIVSMLWEDKKTLLYPETLAALKKEKSSPAEQIRALEAMAADMLLDKTRLMQPVIDKHLFIPVPSASPATPNAEARREQLAKRAEATLKTQYPFAIPVSKSDVEQRIDWITAQSTQALAHLKLQAVDTHLLRPIPELPPGEAAGATHVAQLAAEHLRQHYLFEILVSADDIKTRVAGITARSPGTMAKLKAQVIESQLSNPALKVPEEGSPVEHIAQQAEEAMKKHYLFEIPVTAQDVEQRIASLKKQIIDKHLEHPAFSVPKGESATQYIAKQAQAALQKCCSFEIPISPEDVEQQIALLTKNKPAKENKAQAFLKLKRLGIQNRKSPLSD